MSKIYIGNLPYSLSEDDLRAKFSEFGAIEEVLMIKDPDTGRPKGFAFVKYSSAESAEAAIAKMDGFDMGGRNLRVNPAKPKNSGGGFGGGGHKRFGGSRGHHDKRGPRDQYDSHHDSD